MLKSQKLFLYFSFSSVIAIILRTILIIHNTDREGLYINQSSKILLFLRAVSIIFSLMFLIIPLFDKIPCENRSRNNDKLLGMSMAIFGGVIMFVGLVDFFVMLQLIWSSNFREMQYLLLNTPNALMKIILAIISFITGWMTTTLSIKILNNQPVYNNYSLGILFIVWSVIRAMLFTKVNNTIVTIDDNLYSIITIIFSILFLFGLSKMLFDVNFKSGYRIVIPSGFILMFYGLLDTVPNYIAYTMNKNIFFSIKDTNGITDFTMSVFAVIFMIIIIYSKGENSKMFERESITKN